MTVIITEQELNEAYTEIAKLREERLARKFAFSDELFEFIGKALGNPLSREPNRLSYNDVAALLTRKGWWTGTGNALSQAYLKDKRNRAKGEER